MAIKADVAFWLAVSAGLLVAMDGYTDRNHSRLRQPYEQRPGLDGH